MRYRVLNISDSAVFVKMIRYALQSSTHISVCTFKHRHKKILSASFEQILEELAPYKCSSEQAVKVPRPYMKGQQYHIYTLTDEVKKMVLTRSNFCDWCAPNGPEDLTFYLKRSPWITLITHEKIAYMDSKNQNQIESLTALGLILLEIRV